MKPAPLTYLRPESVDQALEQLAMADGDAKLLAGGQSLVPLLNLRMARPDVLVDIGRLSVLDFIKEHDGAVVIGATTTQRTVELSPLAAERCPLIGQALHHVGHLQIRNRGTIGGSLAHADPAAELVCAAVALEATLTVVGVDSTREVSAADFFIGPYMTVLGESEILTEISFPATGDPAAYAEFARREGDFAMAGIAAICGQDPATGVVSRARLVATGVGPVPQRMAAAESVLYGEPLSPGSIAAAVRAGADEVDPQSDDQADAGYRRRLVAALISHALEKIRL